MRGGVYRLSRNWGVLALLGVLAVLSGCGKKTLKEGQDYLAVSPPLQTFETLFQTPQAADPKKVEVLYFFWYGCPSCAAFEEQLTPWLKAHQKDIALHRLPAPLGGVWSAHANLFWTARALGLEEEAHPLFFEAVQKMRLPLLSPQDQLRFLVERFGTLSESRVQQAQSQVPANIQTTQRILSQVRLLRSVPAFVIDGRFLLLENDHPELMLQNADLLIRQVQKEKGL